MSEQVIIKARDEYGARCLSDSFGKRRNGNNGPQGYVEIYERDEKGNENYLGKRNLVVYGARELIAQKIVKLVNTQVIPDIDEYICWFGVGSGGANPGDPFNPNPPLNVDTDLYNSIPISATDTTCADFNSGFFYKAPIDLVEFEQDPLNDGSWLIIKTITTLGLDRSVGEEVNEAGLFTALDNVAGYGGPFHLFARITFPTLIKTISRELIFVWYIYT